MTISELLRAQLQKKLDDSRVVVWYDSEQAFSDFVNNFSAPNCHVVSAQGSLLRARREAETIYRELNAANSLSSSSANLLIYLPFKRPGGEAQFRDPFAGFAVAGDTFGDDESEQLESLAHQALPDFGEQIDRLFKEGLPALTLLDQLEHSANYPLVKQVLGTQSVVGVTAQFLGDPSAYDKIADVPGCGQEVLRLLSAELGFAPPSDLVNWRKLSALLGRFVLFSEFVFDLPGDPSASSGQGLPAALANLPRADESHRDRIFAIAERLRDTASYREAYIELANRIEQELQLPAHVGATAQLGQRDTFAFEERQYLTALAQAIENDQLDAARDIITGRQASVWRYQPERAQLWRAAERCVVLLEAAGGVDVAEAAEARSLATMVTAYARAEGWSDLDRQQRLLEQSIAECTEWEELEAVITRCRSRYRKVIDAVQKRFLQTVEATGWPPEGILRQTEIFDRFVAPALAAREKVAYLLADSLRFEMGRDLAHALSGLGETEVQPVAAALPTVTPVGMAALLPGADGTLILRDLDGDLVPHLGKRRLKTLSDRMGFLAEKFGDRFVDVEISDFLSLPSSSKKAARLKNADLVVLRDSRIDNLGETVNLRDARRYMTAMLGDLKAAATQLARLGYSYLVIVADHGHVLLHDVLPGDVIAQTPEGEWPLRKRRSRLGKQVKERAGSRVFRAGHVGILGDASDLVVPDGFGVYTAGSGYFHGGVSLQECIVPLITLRAKERPAELGGDEIQIRYRSDKFTSHVIGLRIWYNSLMTQSLQIKIEAFDGSGTKAKKVGEAADSDARDELTHEVTLIAGQETSVPVLLDPEFDGEQVEIRATNPEAPVIWARLTLKNAMLD